MKESFPLKKRFNKLSSFLSDLIFPKFCLSCRQEGSFLCQKCQQAIKLAENERCPICRVAFSETGKPCSTCKKDYPPIGQLLVALDYQNPLVSSLIHNFKYNFAKELALPLGNFLIKSFEKHSPPLPDLIIPIPLHPRRLRWRGFNQAELLANEVANGLLAGMKLEVNSGIIKRRKYTSSQMKIKDRQERAKNLRDAFSLDPLEKNSLKNKRILLIDDVTTSGVTLFECAKELKKAHPKSITALVVARQNQS